MEIGKSTIKLFGWGTRIMLLYGAFVAVMIFMAVKSMDQNIDLVTEDYYAQELSYQDRIDAVNRTNALTEPVKIIAGDQTVNLLFSEFFKDNITSGEAFFYKPSDKSKDVKLDLSLDENGKQVLSSPKLSKGLYKLELQWKSGGKDYFMEQVILFK